MTDGINVPVYITHYDKAFERKKYLDENLPKMKFPSVTFSSNFCNRETIYKGITQDIVDITRGVYLLKQKYTDNNIKGDVLRPDKPGYLGNFLNHISVWKRIAEGKEDYGLIMEDDTVLLDNAYEILKKQIDNIPEDLDIGFLHSGCNYTVTNYYGITPEPGTIWVKTPKRLTRSMCTYLLTKNAAQRLLKVVFPITCIVDHEMNFLQSVLNFNVYWTVEHALGEGSFLGENKSLVK